MVSEVGNPGSATTLSAPGYTIGDASIIVASTTNWPTATGVIFAIDRAEIEDGVETRVTGTYNEFVGTVASGTSITNLSKLYGTAQNYSAGSLTRVYIPVSSQKENRLVAWATAEHTQLGVHRLTSNSTLTSSKVITDLSDTNGNELLKVTATASAVNELTLANAATGNAPSLTATGGDTNIDVELAAKGAGDINLKPGSANFVQKNGNPIDWWEELGRTTLTGAGDTISITSFAARKYLKIMVNATDTGGTLSAFIRFNNDTAANYSYRNSSNGGADGVAGSATSAFFGAPGRAAPLQIEAFITNISSVEKIIQFVATNTGGAGAASAPDRLEGAGKWANTSAQITRVDVINTGTGDFAIGSEVVVLGHN